MTAGNFLPLLKIFICYITGIQVSCVLASLFMASLLLIFFIQHLYPFLLSLLLPCESLLINVPGVKGSGTLFSGLEMNWSLLALENPYQEPSVVS